MLRITGLTSTETALSGMGYVAPFPLISSREEMPASECQSFLLLAAEAIDVKSHSYRKATAGFARGVSL